MKAKDLLIRGLLRSIFSELVVILFIVSPWQGLQSQTQTTFIEEIKVSEKTTLKTNLPTSIGINVQGSVTTNNTYDRYTIEGKDQDVKMNVLKDLSIQTWDKNIIRQETIIKVRASNKEEEKHLIDNLKIQLKKKANHTVVVDCNLNIEKFKLVNGFFKSDKCNIILKNGKSFPIEYIKIETKLSMPKSCHLDIKGQTHSTIRLGELDGELTLDLKYAEVFGTSLKKLNAKFNWCYNVVFDTVAFAHISSFHSYVNIKNLGGATIGLHELGNSLSFSNLNKSLSNSSQTIYDFGVVGLLDIASSVNDEFSIQEVGFLEVKNANYSSIQADRLNGSMLVTAKKTDIQMDTIAKEFNAIDIENSLSDISLNFEDGTNYTLELNRDYYVEFEPNRKTIKTQEIQTNSNEYYQIGVANMGGKVSISCDKCKLKIN